MDATKDDISKKIERDWYGSGLFSFNKEEKDESLLYSIDTPPPTISGSLHMGHVFSYCHTDFVARFWRMVGKNVFYPIGFDNNGLPTERLVEKIHQVNAAQMSRKGEREAFLKLYAEVVSASEMEFEAFFKKLGLSFDWSLKYDTNSKKSNDMAKMSFADLFYKNLIYLARKPVYWDTTDQTALAQADIEDKELPGIACNIKFTIHSGKAEDVDAHHSPVLDAVDIMTTRPELLPACVCLLYNPMDDRYNGNAVGRVFEVEMVDGAKSKISGVNFVNRFAKTPFGLPVNIIADEDVDMNKGTGLVMCCSFGDWQDVEWIKRLNILETARNIISDNGRILNRLYQEEESESVRSASKENHDKDNSKTVLEARKYCHSILADKKFVFEGKETSYLTKTKNILHSVKCAERSGKPVEILNKPQWYIDFGLHAHKDEGGFLRNINSINNQDNNSQEQLKAYREKGPEGFNFFQLCALETAEEINFCPPKMKKRLTQWIAGLNQDWCISRNRFAGISIPRIELYVTESRSCLFTFLEESSPYQPYDLLKQSLNKTGEKILTLRSEIERESKKANLSFSNYIRMSLSGDLFEGEWLKLLAQKYKDSFDIESFYELDQDLENFVFDTWFTSSISPQLNTGFIPCQPEIVKAFLPDPEPNPLARLYPFSLRPQAHEIIRTWAFYTVAKANLHSFEWSSADRSWKRRQSLQDIIPWKNIALSGWCLARDKTKMSKSKGNVVDPVPLLDKHGADSARYWSSTGNLGTDTPFNEESLRQCDRLVKKIENAVSFFVSNNKNSLEFSSIKKDVEKGIISATFDKWILSKLSLTVAEYVRHFENYEHNRARESAEKFFWADLCDNYIEIAKGRIYGEESFAYKGTFGSKIDSASILQMQNSALATLHHVTLSVIKLFAPFIPFSTERIYQKYFIHSSGESIHGRGSFISQEELLLDEESLRRAEIGLSLVSDVRKHKADHNLSMKSEILAIETKDPIPEDIELDIRCVCNALNAKITPSAGNSNIIRAAAQEARATEGASSK